MARKAVAIRNAADVLETDGRLFGSTLLGTPAVHTWLSRAALRQNNQRRIFDNLSDTEEELREILGASFEAVDIEIVGSMAVFAAARPKPASESVDRGAGVIVPGICA